MSDAGFDEAVYGKLLGKTLPRAIHSEEENERYLRVVEHLMSLGERMTAEQRELLDLLVILIEQFEAQRYASKTPASAGEVIRELMEARGMKFAELAALIGSKGVASEVLSGKRGLSKTNIKRLAKFFGVSAEVFL